MVALTRINNNISALNAIRNLTVTSRDLRISLERLSSGLRINRASDDAAGLSISENLRSQINGLNRAIENSADAISLANTAEGALAETTNRLQRIRVLAVQAANTGTTDAVALQAIQDEIEASIQEITRIADTTQFSTRLLLNGNHSNTATVPGGSVGVSVSSLPTNSTLSTGAHFLAIEQTDAGSITFSDGIDANNNSGAATLTGSTFDTGTYDLVLSNVRARSAREVGVGFTIDQGGSQPTSAANLVAAGSQASFTSEGGTTFTIGTTDVIRFIGTESDGSAFDITIVIGTSISFDTVLTDLNTALTVDSASFDAASGNFVFAATATFGETPLTVSIQIDDDGGGGIVEFAASNVVRNAGNLNDGVLTVGGGTALQVTAGDSVTVFGPTPSNPALLAAQISFTLGATITAGTDTLTLVEQAFSGELNGGQSVTFQNGDREVQFRSGGTAGFPSGETVLIDFDAIINLGGNPNRTFVISAVNNSLNFQIGANAGQNVRIAFGDLAADNLGFVGDTQPDGNARVVSAINVTTLTGAEEALQIVDIALNQVNRQRSALGAFTNRLEATIGNLGVASENLTASESRIRDADIAIETARFTRNQILVQAGISVLAQANLLPQGVLQLLA